MRLVIDAPPALTTERLVLRRPTTRDARAVFDYARDVEVTRFMSWSTHRSLADTHEFLEAVDADWVEDCVGAYVIEHDGLVIGSTGLQLITSYRAATGYVIRRDRWGHGFATEACRAMIALGEKLGFERIEALIHVDHVASRRVVEKSGLAFEGVLRRHTVFPNLSPSANDVRAYAWAAPPIVHR